MTNGATSMMTLIDRIWGALPRARRRLARMWVDNVPDELAVCEYDCPKIECPSDDWVSCERRQGFKQQEQGSGQERKQETQSLRRYSASG